MKSPKRTLIKDFRKKGPASNFKVHRFLYRASENGKFLPFKLGPYS